MTLTEREHNRRSKEDEITSLQRRIAALIDSMNASNVEQLNRQLGPLTVRLSILQNNRDSILRNQMDYNLKINANVANI